MWGSFKGDGPGVKLQNLINRIFHLNNFFNCIKFDLFLRDERKLKSMNEWVED